MLNGRTILIVQRSWPIANELAAAFRNRGARVLSAADAALALRSAQETGVSAAVLDGESREICAALSQRNIPYLVYTGHSHVDDCKEGPIVRKPAGAEEVVAQMEQLIEQRR